VTRNENYESPQNEYSFQSLMINHDKERNHQLYQIQCSQLGSVCAFTQAEPQNKQNKNRPAVTAYRCAWMSHKKFSGQQKYKNLQCRSCSKLSYSKEELRSLLAGVSKYKLDFKARISISIYMIYVRIFSK